MKQKTSSSSFNMDRNYYPWTWGDYSGYVPYTPTKCLFKSLKSFFWLCTIGCAVEMSTQFTPSILCSEQECQAPAKKKFKSVLPKVRKQWTSTFLCTHSRKCIHTWPCVVLHTGVLFGTQNINIPQIREPTGKPYLPPGKTARTLELFKLV